MADLGPLFPPGDKYSKPTSSFFSHPRLFTGLSAKGGLSDSESVMSPTSTLDNKPFSAFSNPFWYDKTPKSTDPQTENRTTSSRIDLGGVGLGIIEALDDSSDRFPKRESGMVLFGSQLKLQIPAVSANGSVESPRDFGINTRQSLSGSFSPTSGQRTPIGSSNFGPKVPDSPGVFTGSLSVTEMELSEDYTCVISHGPNPRTTHIFDNCVVETCVGCSISEKEKCYPSDGFLIFCYTCKKDLGQGKDIYIYRGEKAFCSRECRYQEMLFEEGIEKSSLDSSDLQFPDLFGDEEIYS